MEGTEPAEVAGTEDGALAAIFGEEFFAEDARHAVILALARGRGDRGFTEEEVVQVLDEFSGALVLSTMLELVVKGLVDIDLVDGDVAFRASEAALAVGAEGD